MTAEVLLFKGSMTDTLRYVPNASLDATYVSPASQPGNAPASLALPQTPPAAASTRRSTVLPRVEWAGDKPNIVPFERERFEEVRPLGQGGMGEVVLLKDNDIERMVALKRLTDGNDVDRLLRFVEEIRTVGQLDHPNIVPVHDVGIDQLGRYYFVMKHLQGDTLESIIDKLREGDRATHARFTFPVRVQLFLGVLNALAYAHRKGFIHRDLKPANIMVGPYGEVTVMDWGLARRVRSAGGLGPGRGHPGQRALQPARRGLAADAAGRRGGHPLLHVPRAGPGTARRRGRAQRHLQPHRALPRAALPAPLPGGA